MMGSPTEVVFFNKFPHQSGALPSLPFFSQQIFRGMITLASFTLQRGVGLLELRAGCSGWFYLGL